MIRLPEVNGNNWKKVLRELPVSKFPSLPDYLVNIRQKLIDKEELLTSESLLGKAKLTKYFEEYAAEINSLYVQTIDWSKFDTRPPLDHQKPGVEFLLKNNRCILGDDMGLGKTMTTIYAALSMEDRHKILIVTLKSLKYNFKKEVEFLDNRVSVVDKKWDDNKFVIVHYDALKKWQKEIKEGGFTVVILDEAHKCFPYDTVVQTDKGKLKIGDIVTKQLKVKALSRNNSTGELEYQPVTDFFRNPPGDTISRIHYRKGQQYLKLECTSNHKIYVVNENGYKTAGEFVGGERMFVLRRRTAKEICAYLFEGVRSFFKEKIRRFAK